MGFIFTYHQLVTLLGQIFAIVKHKCHEKSWDMVLITELLLRYVRKGILTGVLVTIGGYVLTEGGVSTADWVVFMRVSVLPGVVTLEDPNTEDESEGDGAVPPKTGSFLVISVTSKLGKE